MLKENTIKLLAKLLDCCYGDIEFLNNLDFDTISIDEVLNNVEIYEEDKKIGIDDIIISYINLAIPKIQSDILDKLSEVEDNLFDTISDLEDAFEKDNDPKLEEKIDKLNDTKSSVEYVISLIKKDGLLEYIEIFSALRYTTVGIRNSEIESICYEYCKEELDYFEELTSLGLY